MWKANRERERPFTCIFRNLKSFGGFTLVEMMVVVSLVVVIVSLTVSAALRARVQSNEAAAIGNLRTLSSAAESFRGAQSPSAYPDSLGAMSLSSPPYLDSAWNTSNQRQGYSYTYVVAEDRETFSVVATPRNQNTSGINAYCVDQSGVIWRYSPGGGAGGPSGCDSAGVAI